jgi:arylsulfatase
MAIYAAQIDRMDQGIGRVVAALRASGALDDTLIMFLSDNGGSHEEVDRGKPGATLGHADSFASYGLPWAGASNTPFRLYKTRIHEGGIATPFIAHWPAGIAPGRTTHQAAHVIDVMATCLDVAGLDQPRRLGGRALTPIEGRSLAPLFRGARRAGHATLAWEHEGNRAVRAGRHKLVAEHGKSWELYDLDADRGEMVDLAAQRPAKVAELSRRYDAWARRCGVVPWDDVRPGARKAPRAPDGPG